MRRSLKQMFFAPLLLGGLVLAGSGPAFAYTLTATPTTAAPGATATVTWTAATGTTASTDWIALARVGSATNQYLAWRYTGGALTGTLTFTLPTTLGDYEFRYFLRGGYTLGATSPVVTVSGTTVPPAVYTLTVTPTTAAPGATATVGWTATLGSTASSDWIALAAVGSANTSFLAWRYTGGALTGTLTFTLPTAPGTYEFRYFTKGSYTRVATSPTVRVQ